MSDTRCTNCGGDLSASCCNHPGRVWDFPMDFPPDPIPALEAEIARLTAERDAAMAGRVKVKLTRRELQVLRLILHDHITSEVDSNGQGQAMAERILGKVGLTLAALQPGAERAEPVAWRVRVSSDDPEEWSLLPAGGGADYVDRRGYEVQPLYTTPQPAPAPQAREIAVQEAADVLLTALERAQIDTGILRKFHNGEPCAALRAIAGAK